MVFYIICENKKSVLFKIKLYMRNLVCKHSRLNSHLRHRRQALALQQSYLVNIFNVNSVFSRATGLFHMLLNISFICFKRKANHTYKYTTKQPEQCPDGKRSLAAARDGFQARY